MAKRFCIDLAAIATAALLAFAVSEPKAMIESNHWAVVIPQADVAKWDELIRKANVP